MSAETSEVRCVVDARNKLGEVPVWDVAEQALYWVDIEGRLLQRYEPATGAVERWHFQERVCALALRETGGLVLALASGFAFFDPPTGAIRRLAAPESHLPTNRMNDGKCDRRGRFWAGTMDDGLRAPSGALYRLDPDLSCHRMEGGIGISNSLAWSPDDRVFYFADSLRRTIFAYDFDVATGRLGKRRVFTDCADQPGTPDGSTVDAEGFLWNAQWDGWRLVRYAPDGRVDRVVLLPVQKPTSCMFGGTDLRTLYVTSAVWDLEGDALAAQPHAGGLLALDVGVGGLPEPRFAG
ncbi:SMP-30/gluconolactonase/LRE family protein [Lichenifustis flavocetrariae]|uniref:SMP-30/gluconolactonase/LRE family protein n=1 Tax=Lichenifustis flavocetrariae TaxID=2949735 RepID=A0AA41YZ39_9HYPH|nr:SMP-30/gluconolactonase/LRE family protein [Lichenifustis flavocetrariae]MCW6510779.1 SMP-30/gluconolactonase/LRE family protein [Lichenifustis flavocetrariae]